MANRYKMESDPHGYCIIFNNEFSGVKRRKGTNQDRLKLKSLFNTLKYKVIIEENKNAHEIFRHLEKISSSQENECFDSFVCCFLSHGDESGIYGNDNKSFIRYTAIWSLFGRESSTLHNKPKIFIIQSCQTPVTTRHCVADPTTDANKKMKIDSDLFGSIRNNFQDPEIKFDQSLGTQHADILFIYSSVPGRLFYMILFLVMDNFAKVLYFSFLQFSDTNRTTLKK